MKEYLIRYGKDLLIMTIAAVIVIQLLSLHKHIESSDHTKIILSLAISAISLFLLGWASVCYKVFFEKRGAITHWPLSRAMRPFVIIIFIGAILMVAVFMQSFIL